VSVEISINGSDWMPGTLDVQVEHVDVTSAFGHTTPDPRWEHWDTAGHFHAYDDDGQLPTLRRGKKRWRCVICREKVTPGTRTDYGQRSIPGRTSWSATVGQQATELADGTLVSVRVRRGDRLGFGVGKVRNAGTIIHITGAGPLGWRRFAPASRRG
jgi:hypothetical protein